MWRAGWPHFVAFFRPHLEDPTIHSICRRASIDGLQVSSNNELHVITSLKIDPGALGVPLISHSDDSLRQGNGFAFLDQ